MSDTAVKAEPRLKKLYEDKVVPELRKQFKYGNVMEIPKIEKIIVSMGVGAASRLSLIHI